MAFLTKRLGLLFCCLLPVAVSMMAQDVENNVRERLELYFKAYTTTNARIGTCGLDSFRIDHSRKRLLVYADSRFACQPFRPETTEAIYRHLKQILPGPVNYYDIILMAGGRPIEELVPNYYRKGKKAKERLFGDLEYKGKPWVRRTSRPYEADRGLEGRHIALWQSHGKYYSGKKGEWIWQRPRLFCTTEDQFTQSFVLPYLLPMLENAGAVTFTPRERDTQPNEVVVDNDASSNGNHSLYVEVNSRKERWQTAQQPGYAWRQEGVYADGENPFCDGTARFIRTEKKAGKAFAEWVPDIPEAGQYAVYVSYRSLPESVSDAKYQVFHNGGMTEFHVNQQIGGGTWTYLGTFSFDKGRSDCGMVVLSNESKEGGVVCADAVRFGGGMGRVTRGGSTSRLPRYLEGARYAAQLAGMPYPVYAGYKGNDDYADDINVRSRMTNYLAGGSLFNPEEEGLGVPFEMSLALHSDAGFFREDDIVGTLGIYTTGFNEGKLAAGTDRYASRDLSDILLTQLQRDIRSSFDVDWTRRSMWDRNYSETRLPAVSSTIVELLSHQNFADMRLGHDPHFKFVASRALYKGILRYLCHQQGKEYVVQPLPVSHFALRFGKKKNTLELSWRGVDDPLEPSARPREYIVYTRVGRGGFDNGVRVSSPFYSMKIEPGVVYSFKVTAVNRGGESFPSEVLSACKVREEQGTVLIVNGFDRIGGPAVVDTPETCGFDLEKDPGVPYLYDISFCGAQQEFRRTEAGKTLGESGGELEGMKIAGNTFYYPFIHGKAIQAAGYHSFVSCSDEAVEEGMVDPRDYAVVDYILGLEKDDADSDPARNVRYKTFSSEMQRVLASYCRAGGRLLVSGAYVGSDMTAAESDRKFLEEVLKCRYGGTLPLMAGEEKSIAVSGLGRTLLLPRMLNAETYAVTSPDCLLPVGGAFSAMLYAGSGLSAATAFREGSYRTFVMGFPFESIQKEEARAAVMASILRFLNR